ncbi:hypothetical protein R5H30_19360 [Sulfitobacter sp. D35]|uniref:hypothetical protein n=1 Tax=Sulfitobacter sp. D35 TaxID=3083252 RepID=UPI00296E8D32|nr:hypothetical protein [Sulfitobacter sp. D35]MDW4500154.1 hypothetical protein [Sulfitobacter sp. D35]
MKLKMTGVAFAALAIVQACGPAPTPEAQAARQHEIACVSGTVGGSLLGGAIGNAFGGGSGQDILRAAGAGAGAVAGSRYSC